VGSGNELGGSDQGEYYAVAGDAFEVAGTFVTVDAQIFSDETALNNSDNPGPVVPGGPPIVYATVPASTICKVSITIANGSPKTELPTKWIIQPYPYTFNEAWQVYVGPGRIKQAHGFNCVGTSANILYLMFFDGICSSAFPVNGAVPMFTIPVPGGSVPFSWDCIESARFFQQGLMIAPSTTPDVFTGVGSALADSFPVSVELYSGGMQQLGAQPYINN
jgi:hypothetical protein